MSGSHVGWCSDLTLTKTHVLLLLALLQRLLDELADYSAGRVGAPTTGQLGLREVTCGKE